jgi:hypothetical protein
MVKEAIEKCKVRDRECFPMLPQILTTKEEQRGRKIDL